jgi:hypothetical protein
MICKGTLRQVFICLRSPPLVGFCLGWKNYFVGYESVQKQSVKSCRIWYMVSNTTSHPPPPSPPSHTLSVCTVLWLWKEGKGWGRWTRKKVREAIVHKAGSKMWTWPSESPVYKLQLTPVKTTFSLDVFIVNYSMVLIIFAKYNNDTLHLFIYIENIKVWNFLCNTAQKPLIPNRVQKTMPIGAKSKTNCFCP